MKVLVTGANGMLATNIIKELLFKGYSVRGILRKKSSYKGVSHHNLELLEGDFTDFNTIESALEGCDMIIHSAAITAQNLLNYESYRIVNVYATEQLLRIATVKRIKRFLYVSTANTVGYGSPSSPSNEDVPMMKPFSNSMYVRSKKEAEDSVLSYSKLLDVVVVNPTFMIGRYGSSSGSNKILKMARPITFAPSGGKNFIDVEDAARASVAALEWGETGEKYLISGDNLSYKEFFRLCPNVRHTVTIPSFVLYIAGFIGDVVRLFGVKIDLSSVNVRLLTAKVGYSNNKLKTKLGVLPNRINESRIFKDL